MSDHILLASAVHGGLASEALLPLLNGWHVEGTGALLVRGGGSFNNFKTLLKGCARSASTFSGAAAAGCWQACGVRQTSAVPLPLPANQPALGLPSPPRRTLLPCCHGGTTVQAAAAPSCAPTRPRRRRWRRWSAQSVTSQVSARRAAACPAALAGHCRRRCAVLLLGSHCGYWWKPPDQLPAAPFFCMQPDTSTLPPRSCWRRRWVWLCSRPHCCCMPPGPSRSTTCSTRRQAGQQWHLADATRGRPGSSDARVRMCAVLKPGPLLLAALGPGTCCSVHFFVVDLLYISSSWMQQHKAACLGGGGTPPFAGHFIITFSIRHRCISTSFGNHGRSAGQVAGAADTARDPCAPGGDDLRSPGAHVLALQDAASIRTLLPKEAHIMCPALTCAVALPAGSGAVWRARRRHQEFVPQGSQAGVHMDLRGCRRRCRRPPCRRQSAPPVAGCVLRPARRPHTTCAGQEGAAVHRHRGCRHQGRPEGSVGVLWGQGLMVTMALPSRMQSGGMGLS